MGVTQGVVYFITTLIISSSAVTIWSAVLPGAIIHGLWGVAWCIVAIGISPYLERVFDLITPKRAMASRDRKVPAITAANKPPALPATKNSQPQPD